MQRKDMAVMARAESVKNLMDSMKLSLDQSLNALKIQGETRGTITKCCRSSMYEKDGSILLPSFFFTL